jgi:hypothetical protein
MQYVPIVCQRSRHHAPGSTAATNKFWMRGSLIWVGRIPLLDGVSPGKHTPRQLPTIHIGSRVRDLFNLPASPIKPATILHRYEQVPHRVAIMFTPSRQGGEQFGYHLM